MTRLFKDLELPNADPVRVQRGRLYNLSRGQADRLDAALGHLARGEIDSALELITRSRDVLRTVERIERIKLQEQD